MRLADLQLNKRRDALLNNNKNRAAMILSENPSKMRRGYQQNKKKHALRHNHPHEIFRAATRSSSKKSLLRRTYNKNKIKNINVLQRSYLQLKKRCKLRPSAMFRHKFINHRCSLKFLVSLSVFLVDIFEGRSGPCGAVLDNSTCLLPQQ